MTVADLIRMAFRTIGILAAEEAPSAAEQSDAFNALNDMLDSWALEHLVLFATRRSSHVLTPGLNPHTIGTGGTFSTTRPIRVDRASILSAGVERPLALLSDGEWQATPAKAAAGFPAALWADTAYPLMGLNLNPVPNAADTLVLYTWQQLGRFTATSDSFDLPPGYARALRSNLAMELAPDFGVSVSQELAKIAGESKAALKSQNMKPSYLRCDPAVLSGSRFNLITGDE